MAAMSATRALSNFEVVHANDPTYRLAWLPSSLPTGPELSAAPLSIRWGLSQAGTDLPVLVRTLTLYWSAVLSHREVLVIGGSEWSTMLSGRSKV